MPMSATRTLYRYLLKSIISAAKQGLPVTGVVGLPAVNKVLNPYIFLSDAFRRTSQTDLQGWLEFLKTTHEVLLYWRLRLPTVADALTALKTLPQQSAVLQGAEEETREVKSCMRKRLASCAIELV